MYLRVCILIAALAMLIGWIGPAMQTMRLVCPGYWIEDMTQAASPGQGGGGWFMGVWTSPVAVPFSMLVMTISLAMSLWGYYRAVERRTAFRMLLTISIPVFAVLTVLPLLGYMVSKVCQ